MRKSIILFVISSTLIFAEGGWGKLEKALEPKDILVRESGSEKPFTGEKVTKYANGNIRSKVNFINGIPQGKFENYYPGGGTQSKGNYSKGKHDGVGETFYPNGQLKFNELERWTS